jgi:hypothetical protein
MARLANREKASFWTGLLSAATPEASFMTQCMRELLWGPRPAGAPPEPALHRELQAEGREQEDATNESMNGSL